MSTEKRTGNSISSRLRRLMMILVPLSTLYIGISVASTYYFKKQIVSYAETFVDFYIDKIENTVTNINRRMSMLILGEGESEIELDSYINSIKTTDNIAFRNYFIGKLRDAFRMYSMEYGSEYQFFAFFPEGKQYVGANANDKLGQDVWEQYRDDITHRLEGETLIPNSGSQYWQFVEGSGGCNYIIKFYSIREVYVGCWIRPADLIAPLENAVKDGKTTALLFDQNNRRIAGERTMEPDTITIERRFSNLPFSVRLTVHDYGLFQKTFLMQMGLVFLALAMLFITLCSIYFLYNKVLKPIKKFSNNLERLSRGKTGLEEISSSELSELEQANAEFRQLLQKISMLQEEVYEGEIKKQLMYMEYLKLQIEPHFYLNCLNFIYNTIDLGKYTQASRMSVMTAEYMRYLFNNGRDFVCIWEELEHIGHYLEIQKLRFEHAFDYYLEQEEETREARIPPLVIQTFVENCIKYAVDLDSVLQITVTVFSEEMNGIPYTNICITDSGPGFSAQILEQLADQKKYMEEETGHIGISNTIKRLYYTYGDRASISFYNGPVKGAVVDIHIPYTVKAALEKGDEPDESADCG